MKKKKNICVNCGSQLNDEKVCPYCGQPVLQEMATAVPPTVYGVMPPAAPRPVKRNSHAGLIAGLIAMLFLVVPAIIVIAIAMATDEESSAGPSSTITELPSQTLILDVPSLAGASLEEIQAKLGERKEEGDTQLTTKEGAKVTGQAYTFVEETIRFIMVEGKAVSMEFHAAEPVNYKEENDIFAMFGVEKAGNMESEILMGNERQYISVSEKISLFRVESLDHTAKTFETVKITFDSTYGGRLSTEAKPANLEVLEQSGTKDYITGKIRNNTRKTYSYVEVDINLYNADGVQVGSCLDNVTNLEPGQVWAFKAPVVEDGVQSFKIVRVTGN